MDSVLYSHNGAETTVFALDGQDCDLEFSERNEAAPDNLFQIQTCSVHDEARWLVSARLAVSCSDEELEGGEIFERSVDGVTLGGRYKIPGDDESIHVMCIKPGDCQLNVDGEALMKEMPKPLPSAD